MLSVSLVYVYIIFRYLKCDLEAFELSELDSRFDVILLEPPLKEYQRAQGAVFDKYWDWDEVCYLYFVWLMSHLRVAKAGYRALCSR